MKSLKLLILLLFMIPFFLTNVYSQKDPSCGSVNGPCVLANSTLQPCNGNIPLPPPNVSHWEYTLSTSGK